MKPVIYIDGDNIEDDCFIGDDAFNMFTNSQENAQEVPVEDFTLQPEDFDYTPVEAEVIDINKPYVDIFDTDMPEIPESTAAEIVDPVDFMQALARALGVDDEVEISEANDDESDTAADNDGNNNSNEVTELIIKAEVPAEVTDAIADEEVKVALPVNKAILAEPTDEQCDADCAEANLSKATADSAKDLSKVENSATARLSAIDNEAVDTEDEASCTWCTEVFPKTDCRFEVDLGYLCPQCQAAIKSRGYDLTFKEDLDSDSAVNVTIATGALADGASTTDADKDSSSANESPALTKTEDDVLATVKDAARDVMTAYQNANKWLDSTKEAVYMHMSCPFFSDFVHKLAHSMPERFDNFGKILHTLNMEIPYPATAELESPISTPEEAINQTCSCLDGIIIALNNFIDVTDEPFHGAACAVESLLNDIESELPAIYVLQAKAIECQDDFVAFDKYVAQYVERKNDLLESVDVDGIKVNDNSDSDLPDNDIPDSLNISEEDLIAFYTEHKDLTPEELAHETFIRMENGWQDFSDETKPISEN